jgi:hypothetical protein
LELLSSFDQTAGKELELDRGVSVLMKELEGRLGVTLKEESKVNHLLALDASDLS